MISNFSIALPYFLLLMFSIIVFLFEEIHFSEENIAIRNDSNKNLCLMLLFSIFAVFIGLRGYVNTDWIMYSKIFNIMDVNSEKTYFEPAFNYLMKFSKRIYNNYFFFVFVSSIIDFYLFYEAFKNEKSIFLCFIFFYIFSGAGAGFRLEFNLMRNVKSILIFAISLKYVSCKKFLKYLILNLIGMLFHSSSILYIPMYFFITKCYSKRELLTLFFIGNVIFLLQIHWLGGVLKILSSVLPGKMGILLNVYLGLETYSSEFGISIGYIERFVTFFLALHFYTKSEAKYIPYFNTLFIYLFIYLFCAEMNILLTRVGLLFIVGYWYVFPRIYYNLNKSNKLLMLCIIILYAFMKLALVHNSPVFIYENILFPHRSYQDRIKLIDAG